MTTVGDNRRWRYSRLKYLFEFERNGVWGDEPTGDGDVICVRVADFDRTNFTVGAAAQTLRSVPAAQLGSRLLQPGDILLEKSGGTKDRPVGCAVIFQGLELPAVCSNFIGQLRPLVDHNPRYVSLLLAAAYLEGRNVPFVTQTTGIQNLDSRGYLSRWVQVPPRPVQDRLVRDIERECDSIDRAVEEHRRFQELLDEHWFAWISDAIGSKLGEEAGPWLSALRDLPGGWRLRPLRTLADIQSGLTLGKQYSGPTVERPYLRVANVHDGQIEPYWVS